MSDSAVTSKPKPNVIDPIGAILNQVMLPYQREDIVANDRFRWNCWSRQTGKSFGKAFRRIVRGIARKRNQFFLSAGGRQSRELMLKARQHCENMRLAFEFVDERSAGAFDGVEYSQMEIRLPEIGIRIVGLPANPETARGFTGDVFLDEFAMHRYDRQIWAAMFPSVMRGGGELDVASTPKGKQNMFYELGQNSQFGRQTVTINDAVAAGLDVDVAQLRAAMGDDELFRQEFLCEFVDEATAFLTLDLIRACEDEQLPRELDVAGLAKRRGDVLVGVDVGRTRDMTVIWAIEAIGTQLITIGLIEYQGVPFDEQLTTIKRILDCRCVRKLVIDRSGIGFAPAETLARYAGQFDRDGKPDLDGHRVWGVNFSANVKEEMAGRLRLRMESHRLTIPADQKIRDDLHSVEKSVTIDGHVRLRATRAEGSHADRFWALALAVYGASDNAGPIEIELGPPLRSGGARRL